MNWDTVHISLLAPFGYDWRGSHFLIDIAKIRLIFELQNILRKNFVNLTTINVSGRGVTCENKRRERIATLNALIITGFRPNVIEKTDKTGVSLLV